jgi:16S rRNA (uracil1498-N3)-methyltransferase
VGGGRDPAMITLLARPGSLVAGAAVPLEPEEEHHLAVRRAGPEAAIEVLDGAGSRAEAVVRRDGRRLCVKVERLTTEPPPVPLVLAVGAGDRDRFGLLAEQAAQLGATRLVPLETVRTLSVATRLRPAHLDRIRRRAREGIKQSGAVWAPTVDEPVPLAGFLSRPRAGTAWLADAEGAVPTGLPAAEPLTVAVGPEGGFTEEELALLRGAGFSPMRLGPHLLRFETAAVAALTTAWLARQRDQHG